MGKVESLDTPNHMAIEFEYEERRDERLVGLCQQSYTRKNKDAIVIPTPGSNALLNDATMPSNDSFETNPEVHVPSPLTFETATLNPQVSDQGRRYPFYDYKEPNRLDFSKLSSNVVYPISNFVYRLSKAHPAFALQLSFVFIPNHF